MTPAADEPVAPTQGAETRAAQNPAGETPAAHKTAFVLAGGGAKGAFEAGAVRYLVEEEGVVPEIITATSAGALCAAVLAQARNHRELLERARELHDDLLAMTRSDLLFGKQPWVAALEGTLFGRVIDHFVVESTRPAIPGTEGEFPDTAPAAPAGLERTSLVVSLPRRGRTLRLAGQVARSLPSLGRAWRRRRGPTASLLTLDPLAERLRRGGRGIAAIDPALVACRGLELRLAVVALGAGVLRYVCGDGSIVAADARTVLEASGTVDVIDGVIASASVPMIFPPRTMAGDAYVDGGVVENVPVAAAASLGASRIYAILAVPIDPPVVRRDYGSASAPEVLLRVIGEISFSERQRANLSPTLPPGTELTVIDPLIDIVGPFDVARGLMLLNMDYGWLRAADMCADLAPSLRRRAAEATDAVAVARTQAWHREEELWAAGDAAAGDMRALARCKRVVRDALSERKGLGLPTPPDAARWWSGYEVHEGRTPRGLPPDLLDACG